MILGAFGDSFLFGSDLSDSDNFDGFEHFYPSNLTYPALLAKKLNLEYYCTARPAQSNKIIADDIIRAISYHKNSMIYIVNWTWTDRFEYIGEENDAGVPGWCTILPTDNDKESTFFYKKLYSEIDAKLSNLFYINTTLDCLIENKCMFIMTFMDYLTLDKKFHCPRSIDVLQNRIMQHLVTFEDLNFLDWSKKNNFPVSENWHPLEQAHEAAADYLFPMANHLLHTKYPGGQNK
jgi:hypothetical protein